MHLSEFLQAAKYRISEGSKFQWECFGPNARYLDVSDGNNQVGSCVFDSSNQTVFLIQVGTDDQNQWMWLDPEYAKPYLKECKKRKVSPYQAYDDVNYSLTEDSDEILNYVGAFTSNESDNWPFLNNKTEIGKESKETCTKESSPQKETYKVRLNVKMDFDVTADSMEEAAQIAEDWAMANKSTEAWPKGLIWNDRWVSKRTVSK